MAEGGDKPSGGLDPWILIFLVLAVSVVFNRGDGNSFFGGSSDGVKYGSPSQSGTVEEEIRQRERSNFFFNPSPPPTPSQIPAESQNAVSLPTKDNLSIQAFGSTNLSYAEEYIQLTASNLNRGKINISGVTLKNKNNESVKIGTDEFGGSILLNPGDRAIISTIPSPRGFNFKVNKCSGYLAQAQRYYPSLDSFCPHISLLKEAKDMTEKCERYINSIGYCTTPIISFQTGIDDKCSNFISQHASYPGCVADFKKDSDFDRREWRIYLGLTREFWNNRGENIRVFDQRGESLFEISY